MSARSFDGSNYQRIAELGEKVLGSGALGGYGMSVLAAITAQNTQAVTAVFEIPVGVVEQQIEAEDDYRICARRGSTEKVKPKKKRRKMNEDDE